MEQDTLPSTLEPVDCTLSQAESIPENGPVWGRLLPLKKGFTLIELRENCCTFGRGGVGDVDVSFDNDTLRAHKNFIAFSKTQFRLLREESATTPHTVIEDLSTNGTFVNREKIGKNKRRYLCTNDEIALAVETQRAYLYVENGIAEYDTAPPELKAKYIVSKELGRGAMGEVRLAFTKDTCTRLAVKIVAKSRLLGPGGGSVNSTKQIEREIGILRSVKHPCIVEVYDVYDTPDKTFIVMELIDGGELFNRIVNSEKCRLKEPVAKSLFYQLLLAVKYLHDMGITHRDLKPENILLASDEEDTLLKVTDFGLSKFVDSGSVLKTLCGTPNYLAPEILKSAGSGAYTKAVDMWSLGVILFVALSGYMPFSPEYKDMPLPEQILNGRYTVFSSHWKGVTQQAFDLVKRLLTVDPMGRPTAADALEDPWLQDDEMKRKVNELMYPRPGITVTRRALGKKRSADEETESAVDMDTTLTAKKPRSAD